MTADQPVSWWRALRRRLRVALDVSLARDELDDELACPHQEVGLCDLCYADRLDVRTW